MEIFNTHLEFNRHNLLRIIDKRIEDGLPGYVCVCDSSVITRLQRDDDYRKVINGSFVNTCDGSIICTLANRIYGGNLESVNGPELFSYYTKRKYKQVIIGNTEDIVEQVRNKLNAEGYPNNKDYLFHLQVPFCKVYEFDYNIIAKQIEKLDADIIWVSLGNPKQEIFCSLLQPLLKKGVMFGIGAALNFWVGDLALPSFHIGSMRFIWLTRIFQDPKRQIKMNWKILRTLPSMYIEEKKRSALLNNKL